jgi:hypothetical protein
MYATRDTVAGNGWAIPRQLDDPLVQQALATTPGRAMAQFARFLTGEVDSSGVETTVYLRDARYARAGREGWGVVPVTLRASPPTARRNSAAHPTDGAGSGSAVRRRSDDLPISGVLRALR